MPVISIVYAFARRATVALLALALALVLGLRRS
jgi:hypothetical protein